MPTAIEFYNSNKDINWSIPKPPNNISTDYEIANWLLNESDFGWLQLDINFDLDEWKKEAIANQSLLVPHRESDSHGWNGSCIHGIDVGNTGSWNTYGYTSESDVPYHWTSLSEKTPNITNFWKQFPYERYRRIRFMEVVSDGYISPHSDMPGRLPGEQNFNALEFGVPINVAIIHPKDCYMTLEGYGCVPFVEGRAFIINIRNYHSVINFSKQNRIHLIAHGIPGNRKEDFIELIARSYRKEYLKTYNSPL
jgi:hypothetical protein